MQKNELKYIKKDKKMVTKREIEKLKNRFVNYRDVKEVYFECEVDVREIRECDFCSKELVIKFVRDSRHILCENCYDRKIKEIDNLVETLKSEGLMQLEKDDFIV